MVRAILTFHSIDDSGSLLSYGARAFESLLAALHRADIPVRGLDELLRPTTRRGVALTFDDGLRSVFTHGLPLLQAFAAPAHLFLTTQAVGADNRWHGQPAAAPTFPMVDWRQVEALHAAGVAIESHTGHHPDLRGLDDAAVVAECARADDAIERRLGRRPRYFAYPYGHHDARVRRLLVGRYGACVTTDLRYLGGRDDLAALPRLDSYYLRTPWTYRDLGSPRTRAYLAARHGLRRLRGA